MKIDYEEKILQVLFKTPGLTRTEIADLLNSRKNTIGEFCNKLLDDNKIITAEPGKQRNAGLILNTAAITALGIEHTLDEIRFVLLDAGLERLHKTIMPLPSSSGEERVKHIRQSIGDFLNSCKIRTGSLVGVGYSDFIPHDIGTGLKVKSIWMPNWGNINIKAGLEECCSSESWLMRCTDAYAIAEHVWGSCKGPDPFIVVELGDGIGVSVFMNGSFIKGTTDIFGEMGHTVYREDGDICKCGNRGCLETFAGRGAIINKVKENLADNLGFFLKSSGNITFEDICLNAAEENKLALLVLRDAAKAIGDTIANVVNVLGITKVILYGETVKAGAVLTDEIQNSIRKHCIYPLNQGSEIIMSELDVFASASGAAFFAIDKFFCT